MKVVICGSHDINHGAKMFDYRNTQRP